jgi:hypothetical protein
MTTTKRALVLDTNLVHYAPSVLLQALADHGFALRVSVIALEERLARCASEGIDKLRVRLRNIARFIDPLNPIAPQGGPLYARLGIHHPDPNRRQVNDGYNAALPGMWANLTGTGELTGWQRLADGMDGSINRNAALMRSRLKLLTGVPKDGVTYGEVLRETRKTFADHPVVRRFGNARLDAHISRLAGMIFDVPKQPSENDIEDLALLAHLVDDVILVTGDSRSIAAIDATGSLQSPFVRSAWEILEGMVPDGPPWGPSAVAALSVHARRTRQSLRAVEATARARLSLPDTAARE